MFTHLLIFISLKQKKVMLESLQEWACWVKPAGLLDIIYVVQHMKRQEGNFKYIGLKTSEITLIHTQQVTFG